MTIFDNTFRALAKSLVDSTFGTRAVYRIETNTFNIETGNSTKSTTDRSILISPPAPVRQTRVQGVIEMGDIETVVAATTFPSTPPDTTGKLIWRGEVYQVVMVSPMVSGDQDAAYRLFLRK